MWGLSLLVIESGDSGKERFFPIGNRPFLRRIAEVDADGMDGLAFFAGGAEVFFGVGFFADLGEGGVCCLVELELHDVEMLSRVEHGIDAAFVRCDFCQDVHAAEAADCVDDGLIVFFRLDLDVVGEAGEEILPDVHHIFCAAVFCG